MHGWMHLSIIVYVRLLYILFHLPSENRQVRTYMTRQSLYLYIAPDTVCPTRLHRHTPWHCKTERRITNTHIVIGTVIETNLALHVGAYSVHSCRQQLQRRTDS